MRFCVSMRIWSRYINFYFALATTLALLGAGCKTDKSAKVFSALRVHVQVPRMTATGTTISVIRANPVLVNVSEDPILTESDVTGARILNSEGGFALQIGFDEQAAWILEQYSAANPGKHLAIFGQWGESTNDARWLAVPLITQRISDGVLTFTPDMSRDEANQFVLGLNNDAEKILKSVPKPLR
jgi:preprotein translocase subunit SecD